MVHVYLCSFVLSLLSMFICVYLCSSVVKILKLNFIFQKKYQMPIMLAGYCHL